MAFLAPLMPYLAAAGTAAGAVGAIQQSKAATFNSQVMRNEATVAGAQGVQAENAVRRQGREVLGRQAAAFGASGGDYGGSAAAAMDQSAVNIELDALNTRYKGRLAGYGYGVQAQQDQQESKQLQLTAGAALLKGLGSNYSYAPQQPSVLQNNPGLG